jgi:hypothetical protein
MCDVQKFLVWLSNYQIFKKNCWLEFPLMVGNAGLLPDLFDIDACRHYVSFVSLQKSECLTYEYMYAVIPVLWQGPNWTVIKYSSIQEIVCSHNHKLHS